MQIRRGVVYALRQEQSEHYARFLEDYELIRAAEGRGSQDEHFYLGLPFRDATGRNSGEWSIRSRSYNYLLTRVLRPQANHGREF